MSLPVPLAVTVDGVGISREVTAVGFRKEAVGGLRSIGFRLARPLDKLDEDLEPFDQVTISDARSAEVIAQGRVADPGRSAGSDGQVWDIVAFGPAQHASDRSIPYVVVTQDLTPFRRAAVSTKNATTGTDERGDEEPTLIHAAEEGKTVSTSWQGCHVSRVVRDAGMKLARVRCQIDSGVTAANFMQQIRTSVGDAASSLAKESSASTTASTLTAVVVTDFSNGDDVVKMQTLRNVSATTGTEDHWFEYWDVYIRALLLTAAGAEITTGYTTNTVLAHQVVNDLLGRVLDQFDGAAATVDTTAAYAIDQLAYPDGVTAAEVLDDLMLLEPAFRWHAGPDAGAGYSFAWEPWPTTIRYEVTLDDGGDFPTSAQELYNRVTVRWAHKDGRQRATTRTMACQVLDDAGVVRTGFLDLGDEVGSLAAAQRAGDNFLTEHNVPRNAGTLTISRPIRDVKTGRVVQPHEIEPGELILVRGIQAYPDALNADSNDGRTVFRIWALDYASDSHSVRLELDTYPRTVAAALARLARRRTRRR